MQADDNKYSYVLYDHQGRPVEVGQADRDHTGQQAAAISTVPIKADDLGAAFQDWIYTCDRTEVTRTVYDRPYSTAAAAKFAGNIQQNLRLRVAAVLYYPAVPFGQNPGTGYETATHYSYDVHGNVIETLQDVPMMAPVEQDIVSTRYQFELISGNVKKVEYQKERWDAGTNTWKTRRDRMTHEYTYDKLNRLTEVLTSTDNGVHRIREARYRYFDYGPLSRVEIGQHNVQGNDYSYTINGWLKAMNGTTLDRQRDGGKDGGTGYLAATPNVNTLFAPDITGFTLGYYNGDYKSIGATSFEAQLGTGNAMSRAVGALYNGNIAWTTQAIDGYETKAGVYVYDQLQRLTAMRIFHSSALQATNNWNGSIETKEYSSSYAYDENGNLQTLVRKGTASIAIDMDDFTYNYMLGANRLTHVSDANGTTPGYTADIKSGQLGTAGQPITASQSGNNYQYDKLGQLVKDVQEGDQTLTWRFGDKKLLKQHSQTKQLDFIYNPLGQRVVKIEKQCVSGTVQAQTAQTPWIWSYYGYDANGQVMSTYTVTLNGTTNEARIDEQMIYGAGRIGLIQSGELIFSTTTNIPAETAVWINKTGKRRYELTNHLGNVNAVITDRKVVNAGYLTIANENYTSSTNNWNVSSSCIPTLTVSGGTLTVAGSGNCVFQITRTAAVSAGTTYIFSVDVVDRSSIANFAIELYGGISGTFTPMSPAFSNVQHGRFSYTFTVPPGVTQLRYMFRKLSAETNASFTLDNLFLGTAAAQYAAVPVQKMDYYPYGMEMTGGIEPGAIPSSVAGSGTITEEAVVYTNYIGTFTNIDGDLQLSGTGTDNSAMGVQVVYPGEYIEFTAPPDPIGTNRTFVGLSYADGGPSFATLSYSWYLYPDGRSFVYESGANPYTNNVAYVPSTTKWRIARTGGNIVYSKNGVVVRTVAETSPTQPMVIDITMWNTGTGMPSRVYDLVVGKLPQVLATYGSGDYVPYVHSDYKFGYNGMEIDPEMKGAGNSYTTEFRQYDPRLGRWASLDPLMARFPHMSPYVAFDNNPIFFTDPYGLSAGPGDPPTGLPENPVHEQIAKADDDKEYQYVIDQDGNGSWGRYNGEFEVVANKNPMKYVTGNQYKDSPDHDLTKEEIPEYGLNSIDKFAIKNPDDPNSVYKYLEFCFSNGCSAGMDDPGGDLAKEGLSLLEHFVIGGGTQMGLGPDSYASDRAGEDSDFLEMAERFESEAMIYYEKHGNLNQFNGKQILQEEKPYMNDTWYLHTIMGGMAQVTAVINSVSADEISVTYYLWDHFGGGTNDTKTDLPGLSALYHLQHNFNEGNNAKYFTPFVWYIRIER